MDQVINFRTDTNQVTPAAASAAASLQKIKLEQDQLNASFQRGAVNLTSYKSAMAALSRDAATAGKALDKANKAADPAGGATAKGGSGKGGRGLLFFGQAVQDFEAAGMRGITNQIDQLAQAVGIGAGLAGALTIAGVAIQVFLPQIQAFLAQFKTEGIHEFTGSLERMTNRLGELGEKAKAGTLTGLETFEKTGLEAKVAEEETGAKAFAAAQAARSPEELAMGKEIQTALATPRGREAMKRAAELRAADESTSLPINEARKRIAEYDKQIAELEAGPQVVTETGQNVTEANIRRLQGQRAQQVNKIQLAQQDRSRASERQLGNMLSKAEGGAQPQARALGGELSRAGFPDIGAQVTGAQAKVAEDTRLEKDQKAYDENEKEAKKVWEQMEADEKKVHNETVGALMAEGKVNEDIEDERLKQEKAVEKFDADQAKSWASLDKKLAKVGEAALTKEATGMARDQMKELRDPKMFGGTEDFLASVQQAGGVKDREGERELFEQMVTHLKTIAAQEAGGGP